MNGLIALLTHLSEREDVLGARSAMKQIVDMARRSAANPEETGRLLDLIRREWRYIQP